MLSSVPIFNNNINDRLIVESERKFAKSHLACQSKLSARVSGVHLRTRRTDVLCSILGLREQGWDLGHVESFRVEHCVVSAVVHSVKNDLEINNLVGRR